MFDGLFKRGQQEQGLVRGGLEEVRFHPYLGNNNGLLGFVSAKYFTGDGGCIVLNSIGLCETPRGNLTLSFPENKFIQLDFFYLSGPLKDELLEKATDAYDDYLAHEKANSPEGVVR